MWLQVDLSRSSAMGTKRSDHDKEVAAVNSDLLIMATRPSSKCCISVQTQSSHLLIYVVTTVHVEMLAPGDRYRQVS